jgi:hypothetical protein
MAFGAVAAKIYDATAHGHGRDWRVGIGHVGDSMSVVEALVVLYNRHMRIDPRNPQMEGEDRFVLSKGRAGPALYAVLADLGHSDKSLLDTMNGPDTRLPSHCDMVRTPGIDMTPAHWVKAFRARSGLRSDRCHGTIRDASPYHFWPRDAARIRLPLARA